MLQDTVTCGMGSGSIPGVPGVLVSRASTMRDYQKDLSRPDWPGGQYYRFERQAGAGYDPVKVRVNPGLTARLCWCGKMDNCDPSNPADFRADAGAMTILRLEQEVNIGCMIKAACAASLPLASATPMAAGDQLMAKRGTADPRGKRGRLDCEGPAVTGLGPYGDGKSDRLKVDGELGTFSFGLTEAEVGVYIMCWCQASFQPCLEESDFSFFVGSVTVTAPRYVWPACIEKETRFLKWRKWETFDDCCCNYAEAGAVGCLDERSVAFAKCSEYPPR